MVQLIDTPPITADVLETFHQGLIRGADLVLLLVDLGNDDGIEQLQEVMDRLHQTKTRLAPTSYLDETRFGIVVHAHALGTQQDRRSGCRGPRGDVA